MTSKRARGSQQNIKKLLFLPFIYLYGRQVGIGRGSVGIGQSQVGTDRYKSGLSQHKSGLILTGRC